jgi:hypothetical protein
MELAHYSGSDARDVLDGHTISPLFCFGRIQTLHLESRGGLAFELDDAALWDMARAFPELRKFFFGIYCSMVHSWNNTWRATRIRSRPTARNWARCRSHLMQ